jgi:hypothetical protein
MLRRFSGGGGGGAIFQVGEGIIYCRNCSAENV